MRLSGVISSILIGCALLGLISTAHAEIDWAVGPKPNALKDLSKLVSKAVVRVVVEIKQDAVEVNNADPITAALTHQTHRKGIGFIAEMASSPRSYVVVPSDLILQAKSITVEFSDGRRTTAELHSSDEISNIALLKLQSPSVVELKWGDSEQLSVNSWGAVYAGADLVQGNVDGTPRVGAVQTKNTYRYVPILQILNLPRSGDIGSPILNQYGEVVGMLNSLYPTSTFPPVKTIKIEPNPRKSGICYALPSSYVRWIATELKDRKAVRYPWVGLSFRDNAEGGALIQAIAPESPAEKANLQPGDVVIKLNNSDIANGIDLAVGLFKLKVDSTATFEVLRGEERLTFYAHVKTQPGVNEAK